MFRDVPEAIAETVELSHRLDFTLQDLGYEFPKYPVPPGETIHSFLCHGQDEGAGQLIGLITIKFAYRLSASSS